MPDALAIDIGGTKLAVAIVDDEGTMRGRRTTATAGVDAAGLFTTLTALVDAACRDAQVAVGSLEVCGVGCGGPMRAGGETVSPLNIPQWRDFPLLDRLTTHLRIPVVVDNDAKALALGECWRGAARGERDFIAMVVSTGVGGGIVTDGRLLDGAFGNAGHIGHLVVVPGGRPCACGSAGCLEAEASGLSIEAISGGRASDAPLGMRMRTGRLVGEALGSVANLLDLRLTVVAGSVALGFGEPFFVEAQAALDRTARLPYARGARVVPAGLGADGPLIGAAAVGWRCMGVDVGVRNTSTESVRLARPDGSGR